MARQPFPRTDRSHRSGDPGRPRAGAEGHRRRDRAGHRQRPARLRDLARSPGSRASAVDAALPAPAQGTPRRTRRTAGPGDRQEPRRCQGRRVARHRGGRTRRQRGQPDDGRDGGKRRPRDRHRQLDPAPRCVRRDHPVQFPGDDPAVDVPASHRLRQHLRPQALRTGSADTQPPRRAVPRGRRAEGRAAGDSWRPRAGRCPPYPPGHPGDFLRRLGRRRPARVPHRHRAPEAGAGLRRGEEPHGDPPDANKAQVLGNLVGASCGAAGQRCMAISAAVFVGAAREWIPELAERMAALRPATGRTRTPPMVR